MPKQKEDGKKKGSRLPKEAMAFARAMGFDLKGLEPEAHDIWEKLNSMAKSNPFEYENFVRNAMEEGKSLPKPGAAADGGGVGADPKQQNAANKGGNSSSSEKEKEKDQPIYIRPQAGFVIKLMTVGGEDGVKVREFVLLSKGAGGLKQGAKIGRTIFVNMCSYKTINPPKDDFGVELNADTLHTNGVEIPLVIGYARDVEAPPNFDDDDDDNDNNEDDDDESGIINLSSGKKGKAHLDLAIDVLLHPVVVDACSKKGDLFRRQVVELALGCIESERNILLDKGNWALVTDIKYGGGRGEDKQTPALFAFNKDGIPVDPNANNNEGGLDSKSNLLDSVLKSKTADDQEGGSLFGSNAKTFGAGNGNNDDGDNNGESSLFSGIEKPGIKLSANGDSNLDKMMASSKKKKTPPTIVEIGGSSPPQLTTTSESSIKPSSSSSSAAAASAEPLPDFIPQGTFTGKIEGYFFGISTIDKSGYIGLGYHKDTSRYRSSSISKVIADKPTKTASVVESSSSSSNNSSNIGSSSTSGFQKGFLNKAAPDKGLFKEEKTTLKNQPQILTKTEMAAVDDILGNIDDDYSNTVSSKHARSDAMLSDVFSDLAKVLIPHDAAAPGGSGGGANANIKSLENQGDRGAQSNSPFSSADKYLGAAYSSLSDIPPSKTEQEKIDNITTLANTSSSSSSNSNNIVDKFRLTMKNKLANPSLKVDAQVDQSDGKISIVLSGIPADDFQHVDLQMNDNTIVISMLNDSTKSLALSINTCSNSSSNSNIKVDKNSMQAKAQKKKGTLSITANVVS